MKAEDRRQAIEVTLRSETIEQARAIGGNVSRGIEMAIYEYARMLEKPILGSSHDNPFAQFSAKAKAATKETIKRYRRPSNQT